MTGRSARSAARPQDASLGDLVDRLTDDLSRLMRADLEPAKAEAKEEAGRTGRGACLL
jgi:hypothetical protein